MLGTLESGRLTLEELHRFPNTPVRVPPRSTGTRCGCGTRSSTGWPLPAASASIALDGIGVDTWGVDFAPAGRATARWSTIRATIATRATTACWKRTFEVVPREEIFAHTGIQFMQINTLYQLYAMRLAGSPALESRGRCSSCRTCSITGSPALRNPSSPSPAPRSSTTRVAKRLGDRAVRAARPARAHPARNRAPRDACWARCCRRWPRRPAGHDAGVRHRLPRYGLGRGRRSGRGRQLVLHQLRHVVADGSGTGRAGRSTTRSLALNLTNEMGAAGKMRLLKNIAGLWLLQECRRAWALAGSEYSYEELARLAAAAPAVHRGHRSGRIPRAGRHAGENRRLVPATRTAATRLPAAFCRATILESLALRYRAGAGKLESLLGRKIEIDPHRGRRLAQPRAEPVRGRCHRPHGDRRTGRGYRHRQYSDPGDGCRRSFPGWPKCGKSCATPLDSKPLCPIRRPRGTTPMKDSVKLRGVKRHSICARQECTATLLARISAVDHQVRTRNEAGLIGGQEQRGIRHLARFTEAI